ncbi:hypothetical protein WR25_12284 isoform A [Diploscapter pachys]|uniref:Peptidase M1 leukotriene A4 hydrolase/aminopeptidase C-terminal domain-containing protein n=3 Tax=Diploscapter pachys TaxID=2018661 RepID=A0A2A2JVH6_9BILA|nr:hypothetical protein WR25_12284 isoform A [Diploscapter pachys]
MCQTQYRFKKDPCSCANNNEVDVEHISIKWEVCFQLRMLIGSATLRCKMLTQTDKIQLDVRDLAIRSVSINGKDCDYRIAPSVYTFFGSKMKIYIPNELQKEGLTLNVTINYSTSPDATALQWMKKDQTVDKKAPYLFSQCQAIHARSIVPCMDTPSVKTTYEAEVTVPAGLTCLMSAISEGSKGDEEKTTFFYKQPVAIPSYLIAIVAGLLEKRDISPRCAVWAEPSVVDKAHWEFSETEDILATAEEIAGEYIWGRYDMVCLPNSFPFGGMENPCLIAHSWSGNLVTNSSWESFWLNEGFTTFIERKICGRLVSESYRQFMSFNGWTNSLIPAVYEQFAPTHQFTKLIQDHTNVDPDVAFSCVPYEKGSALLFYLEQLLGGPEIFEEYLRNYIKTFAHKAIDSNTWKKHLYEYFHDKKEILDGVNWQGWFYAVGMPPNKPVYDETMVKDCENLLQKWLEAGENEVDKMTVDEYKNMQPLQQIEFLSQLRQHETPIEHYKLDAINKLYQLNESENCEILLQWIRLCIKAKWDPIIEKALKFVETQGRMKYARPVYR